MPIYEYECQKCKAHTEIMQKITDKPLTKCRKCGGKLEKLWSVTSFQLKGTGWYVTDYAGKKNTEEKKSESASTKTTSDTPAAEKSKAAETTSSSSSKKSQGSSSSNAASGKNTGGD